MNDIRSRKVAFLAYCILDQNVRADGIAEHPGPITDIVEKFIESGVGMVQMPCPELLYKGLDRSPHPMKCYNNKEFRAICRKCSEQVTDQVKKYVENNYQVVGIIGVEHSPSCAVKELSSENDERVRRGRGIFIEELIEKLGERGLDNIPVIGAYIKNKIYMQKLEEAITHNRIS